MTAVLHFSRDQGITQSWWHREKNWHTGPMSRVARLRAQKINYSWFSGKYKQVWNLKNMKQECQNSAPQENHDIWICSTSILLKREATALRFISPRPALFTMGRVRHCTKLYALLSTILGQPDTKSKRTFLWNFRRKN